MTKQTCVENTSFYLKFQTTKMVYEIFWIFFKVISKVISKISFLQTPIGKTSL